MTRAVRSTGQVEFGVLGPLEVVGEQGVLALTAPKQRAIVTALLVQANRVVPFDRLAEALWGDHPPSQASGALQVYVSNLRRVLELGRAPRSPAQVLVSVPPGYMLVVPPDRYDVTRFEAALAHGQGLMSQGRTQPARDVLTDALALWRGAAFGEFAGEPFAEAEANRLEELRIVAEEARLDCDLALGRHAAVAVELERMVTEHPLRERMWGSLMVALYRDGRQADALRAFRRCREVLGAELGLDPSPRLRELEHAILTQSDAEPLVRHSTQTGATVTAAPPPGTGTDVGAPPGTPDGRLVGREEPLSVLGAAWHEVEAGRGGVVLVTGEPGIGKTSLVEHFTRRAAAAGATVAWGSCFSGTAAPAFWPWTQILRSLVAACDATELGAALARSGLERTDLAPLLPEWSDPDAAPPTSAATPAEALSRLFGSITAFASVVTAGHPAVLVLDDLHWADVASLQLMEFIAPHLPALRLLVVGTYRDDEVDGAHPLAATLAGLARLPSIHRIPVPGLTAGEVATFLGAVTGTDPAADLAAALHARTDGNPFFLIELVRLLQAEGGVIDPAAVARSRVPVGVRDVIRRRLARLPEQTNALLAIAAVVGLEFDLDVLEIVSGLDEGALDAVELALLTGIVIEDADRAGHYRFSHALIRQTLHDAMSGVRRARLHARVGEALESRAVPPAAAELADHFFHAAGVVGPNKGYQYALQASRDAETALAFDSAEDHLRRALELAATMPTGPDRDRSELDAVVTLGVLATMTRCWADGQLGGIWARARELCERTGDATRLFGSLWGLYWVAQTAADGSGADQLAPELMTLAEAHEDPGLLFGAHYAAGSVAFFRGDLRSAEAHYGRAADLVDEVGAEALAVYPIHPVALGPTMLAPTRWMLGHPEHAWSLLAGSVRRAEVIAQPFTTLSALVSFMFVAVADGRVDVVERTSARLFTVATEYGFAQFVTIARVYLDWAQAHTDDPAIGTAARMRRNLAELWAGGWRVMRDFELAMLAEAQRRAGDVPAALASIDDGLALVDATGWHFWEAELHRLRGELLGHDPATAEEAVRSLHRAVEVATRQGAVILLERARASLERLAGTSR